MNKNEAPDHLLDLIYRCCGLSSAISKEGYERRLMLSSRGLSNGSEHLLADRYSYTAIAGWDLHPLENAAFVRRTS
jgi:hypothetical protein